MGHKMSGRGAANSEKMIMGVPPDTQKESLISVWMIIVLLTMVPIIVFLALSKHRHETETSGKGISSAVTSTEKNVNEGSQEISKKRDTSGNSLEDGFRKTTKGTKTSAYPDQETTSFSYDIGIEYDQKFLTLETKKKLRGISERIGDVPGRLRIILKNNPNPEKSKESYPASVVVDQIAQELRASGVGSNVRIHKLYFDTISFVRVNKSENGKSVKGLMRVIFKPDQ